MPDKGVDDGSDVIIDMDPEDEASPATAATAKKKR